MAECLSALYSDCQSPFLPFLTFDMFRFGFLFGRKVSFDKPKGLADYERRKQEKRGRGNDGVSEQHGRRYRQQKTKRESYYPSTRMTGATNRSDAH